MKIIGLFGPAGSGKSTQGKIASEKYGWRWLSTGELLRQSDDAEVLAWKERYAHTGELFGDASMLKILVKALAELADDGAEAVILDGYPRTEEQVRLMEQAGLFLDFAIEIKLSPAMAWQRIQARGRSDDNEDIAKRRQSDYEHNMYSIRPLLEKHGTKFADIDGDGTLEEVAGKIEQVLNEGEIA